MRALTISAHGGLERVEFREDLDIPEITRSNEVRVRLFAAALNRLDLWTIGGLPGITIRSPWILGADGAGEVDAVGDAVTTIRPGDAVFINPGISCRECEYCRAGEHSLCVRFGILGEHHPGTFAEYVVVPEPNVRVIATDSPWEKAAAYPLAALTAWRACVTRAAVRHGDRVLIWGIGGGVAVAALRICKLLGAHVTVTSSSDAKLERARELGADETLRHDLVEVGKELRARTGKRGVDVIIDSTGEKTWEQSLIALGKRGRLVTYGGTTGPKLVTDVRRLFWNQWSILGTTMGNDAEFDAITVAFRDGDLAAVVDRVYPLEEGRVALERLQEGEQFGKIVLRIA
ncbi:MAG: zinc-binding dehydrogenase [Gemmatimonadaceae bacterium]